MTSDKELVSGLVRRDPDCLAAAYDRYAPACYSLIIRITRDREAAEDLLQELFLRVWNRSQDFDGSRGSLGPWIASIARNMAIDYVRSPGARFRMRLLLLERLETFSCPRAQSECAFTDLDLVRRTLSSLPARQREILELAYFEGCSQSEIAKRLKMPLGTVKSWTRTALQGAKAAIESALCSP